MDKTQRDILLDKYVEQLVKAWDMVDGIKAVVKSFDGKVYNRRLENALQACIDGYPRVDGEPTVRVSVKSDDNMMDITLHFNYCYAKFGFLPSGYDYVTVVRLLVNYYCDDTRNKAFESKDTTQAWYYFDGKGNLRIHADNVITELENRQKLIAERINTLKVQKGKVEEFIRRKEEIEESLKSLRHDMDFAIGAFYNIKANANWY